ncbi:MAG: hypothetical protein KBF12_12725 [Sebaldella sp.]|nr:hypothetical protein [Sebaldella sp.]
MDKYRLIYIEKGTFEDIFDIAESIKIINKMYPGGEEITEQDFIESNSFLKTVEKIIYFKKKAVFNKVEFAEKISYKIPIEKIPKEVEEIIEIVKKITSISNIIVGK